MKRGFPQPQAWTAHRWRYANAEESLNRGCVWEPASGLGMCGDWLNDGTVQGAWLSGKELAQQFVRTHKGQPLLRSCAINLVVLERATFFLVYGKTRPA